MPSDAFPCSFLKSAQIFPTPRDISNKFFIGLSECFSSPFSTSRRRPWSAMKWPHCAGHQGFRRLHLRLCSQVWISESDSPGPRPGAAGAGEALCCFTRLKLADVFKFVVPLLRLPVIALWKPCKAEWLETYMCQGDEGPPSLILGCISTTAIYAHFDEIYGTNRSAVRHISVKPGNLREDVWQVSIRS